MKKTLVLFGLIFVFIVSSCPKEPAKESTKVKDPTAILDFDINGTLLSTDAAAKKDPDCVLIIQLAKIVEIIPEGAVVKLKLADGKTYYHDYIEAIQAGKLPLAERKAADKLSMGYYGYFLKSIKSVPGYKADETINYYEYMKKKLEPPEGATEEQREQAKKERDSKYCNFVKDFDKESQGDLGRALALMIEARKAQKTVVFDSFFELLKYLAQRKTPYHIVLRTFGSDIDDVVKLLEGRLGVGFIKGFMIGNELKMLAKGGAEVLKEKNSEIPSSAVERTIIDPQEIKKVFDETPHLAIKDEHYPWWKSKEAWENGKMFFSSMKNSKGEPILPIFLDDNIERNFKKNNIVRPVKIVGSKIEPDDNPDALVDTQVFKVETLYAMMYKKYFVELAESALDHYEAVTAQ